MSDKRVIACIDVDCFGIQVVRQLWPELVGLPCALMANKQPNAKMISLSYEAKEWGVTKAMTRDEALRVCPQIQFKFQTSVLREYDDPFQRLSDRMFNAIPNYGIPIERVSMDEFFIDLTDVIDYITKLDHNDLKGVKVVVEGARCGRPLKELAMKKSRWGTAAAVIKNRFMNCIKTATGLTCSVGISYNKQLAKLASSLNKPNGFTLLVSKGGRNRIFRNHPLNKCDGYRGKFGREVKEELDLNSVHTLFDLLNLSPHFLATCFGPDIANRLWKVSRAIDNNPVKHIPDTGNIFAEKNYEKELSLRRDRLLLMIDLLVMCDQIEQKLSQPSIQWIGNSPGLIRPDISLRIEAYTSSGFNHTILEENDDCPVIQCPVKSSRYSLHRYIREIVFQMILNLYPKVTKLKGLRMVVLNARKADKK